MVVSFLASYMMPQHMPLRYSCNFALHYDRGTSAKQTSHHENYALASVSLCHFSLAGYLDHDEPCQDVSLHQCGRQRSTFSAVLAQNGKDGLRLKMDVKHSCTCFMLKFYLSRSTACYTVVTLSDASHLWLEHSPYNIRETSHSTCQPVLIGVKTLCHYIRNHCSRVIAEWNQVVQGTEIGMELKVS